MSLRDRFSGWCNPMREPADPERAAYEVVALTAPLALLPFFVMLWKPMIGGFLVPIGAILAITVGMLRKSLFMARVQNTEEWA